jgi:nicotinate-nucleotide pyrophosphorylase (carboxylating)
MSLSDSERRAAEALIALALSEDLGPRGDVTAEATIPADAVGSATMIARVPGVIAGLPVAGLVGSAIDSRLRFEPLLTDGSAVQPGQPLATLAGPMRSLLAAERTALNFLQRLSGVATLTRRHVDLAAGGAKVLDTRKTTPGYRLLEKYAVRQGGGQNHRIGLFDGILIKDNHVAALGGGPAGVRAALEASRRCAPGLPIEIEVDSWEQFEVALDGRPEIILLDNMSPELMARCAARRNQVAPAVELEASGGVNLSTIATIARTGVDRISVGAITHSAPAMDIALDYRDGRVTP